MKYLKRILGILWLCSGFFITVAVAAEPQPQRAPVSARFAQYVNRSEVSKSAVKPVDSVAAGVAKSTGYIPSPLDYSHLRGKSSQIVRHSSALKQAYALLPYEPYEPKFDLRAEGRVTPVRDQGSCGACWTFGTLASLESALLPSESADFSENNLKNTSGFDWHPCAGGNADMAVAYLSRWSGPVAEADDPYSAVSAISPSGLSPKKHVQEVLILPGRGSKLDNDGIKRALMEHGAITTYIFVDEGTKNNSLPSNYNSATRSYYYNGAEESNHIVAIVGWDDTYSAGNFATPPAGNGAFIIKNS